MEDFIHKTQFAFLLLNAKLFWYLRSARTRESQKIFHLCVVRKKALRCVSCGQGKDIMGSSPSKQPSYFVAYHYGCHPQIGPCYYPVVHHKKKWKRHYHGGWRSHSDGFFGDSACGGSDSGGRCGGDGGGGGSD